MNNRISEKDLELLSSYLDHQLSPSEKEEIRLRLEKEQDLKSALDGLRRTKHILAALPSKPVPRNFTLPIEIKKSRVDFFQVFRAFRFSSAAAVLGLIVLLFVDLLMPALRISPSSAAKVIQAPAVMSTEQAGTQPMIITWETPQPQGFGRGGGAADTTIVTQPTEAAPQALQAPLPMEHAKKAPAETQVTPSSVPAEPGIGESAAPVTGTGPILGVPPTEERGVLPPAPQPAPIEAANPTHSFRILEIGLGIIAIASALIAFLARRKLS